jgi:hypothetical protein
MTLYLGPIALVLYVPSCKEPFRGAHERFITPLWKQGPGSTIHCVAGDATGSSSPPRSPGFWGCR